MLERNKEIKCTEKVGDTKILIDTDDTFLMILLIWKKENKKYRDINYIHYKRYWQIFLEEVLVA